MKTNPLRSNSLKYAIVYLISPLPILYRIQKKIVVCDSFDGIKKAVKHIYEFDRKK